MFEVNNKDTTAIMSFSSRVDRSKTPIPSKHLPVQINNRDTRITCKICKTDNKDIRTRLMSAFSCLYCYLCTYFTPSSKVSIVDFEQVNVDWVFGCFVCT